MELTTINKIDEKDIDFETKLNTVKEFVKDTYSRSNCPQEQIAAFNLHNDTVNLQKNR